MARNAYYRSKHWRDLRERALRRDGRKCWVAGCQAVATHVDHKQTRPNVDRPTPFDVLPNLRCSCASHDAQIKETASGKRRMDGKPVIRGCDANGWPLDPARR